jgi:hypothetical protein
MFAPPNIGLLTLLRSIASNGLHAPVDSTITRGAVPLNRPSLTINSRRQARRKNHGRRAIIARSAHQNPRFSRESELRLSNSRAGICARRNRCFGTSARLGQRLFQLCARASAAAIGSSAARASLPIGQVCAASGQIRSAAISVKRADVLPVRAGAPIDRIARVRRRRQQVIAAQIGVAQLRRSGVVFCLAQVLGHALAIALPQFDRGKIGVGPCQRELARRTGISASTHERSDLQPQLREAGGTIGHTGATAG